MTEDGTLAGTQLPLPGDMISDRYEVESLLGRGGFGAVFRGRNTATGRPVAIKWLLPKLSADAEALGRFIAEAKVTARIEHPNVVHIYDVGKDQHGSPFIVMELLRGESLRDRLEKVGRLHPELCVRLLLHALRGVAAAHMDGVVHRDLKPDNIFLCVDKTGGELPTKVVDFGISKLFDTEDEAAGPMTRTGMTIGTPAYMSPEQLNAPRQVDARFDVYAMGIVLYEVLTGRAPYHSNKILELLQQVAAGKPTLPSLIESDISRLLEAVVLKAMHRQQGQRHKSISQLIADLERLTQSGDLVSTSNGGVSTTPMASKFDDSGPPIAVAQSTPGAPYPITTPQPQMVATTPLIQAIQHAAPPEGGRVEPETQSSRRPLLYAIGALLVLGGGAAAFGIAYGLGLEAEPAVEGGESVAAWAGDELPEDLVEESPETEVAGVPTAPEEPMVVPPETDALTFAQLRLAPTAHQGESFAVTGRVYASRDRNRACEFFVSLTEGCVAAPCVVWVRARGQYAPSDGSGVRVRGAVAVQHVFRAADGRDARVDALDATSVERIESFSGDELDLPARLRPAPERRPARTQPVARPTPHSLARPAPPNMAAPTVFRPPPPRPSTSRTMVNY